MSGSYEEKFAQARALYLYMYTHPGKKLNFMGNELGQFREWDEKREQDWGILKYPMHDAFHHYVKKLHHLYEEHPALYQQDYEQNGFQWIDCHQEDRSIYIYERRCDKERILVVLNLSDQHHHYELHTDGAHMELLIDSSDQTYGGTAETLTHTFGSIAHLELRPFSGQMYLLK